MFSIRQLGKIYNKCYYTCHRSSWAEKLTDSILLVSPYRVRVKYNRRNRMTERQWQNLFDVCSVIAENENRFEMRSFHNHLRSCGTTHCIAGWAVATETNNPDVYYVDDSYKQLGEKYDLGYMPGTPVVAEAILSEYITPFFYLTQPGSENILMQEFILPVISEGQKDGLVVSPHVQEMIDNIKANQS